MVIINALIADGNRTELKKGAVYIKDGKIDKVIYTENFEGIEDDDVIDAKGKILAPGFIDVHSHSDISHMLFKSPDSKIFQGITSEVVGSCGISPYPTELKDYLYMHSYQMYKDDVAEYENFCGDFLAYKDVTDKLHLMTNYYSLVGHGAIRAKVMGFEDRKPTPEELEEMCDLLDQQLSEGAVGMSLGLIYPPGIFSEREELVELGRVIARHNKVITVHMRSEGEKIFESVKEMIEVSKLSGARLQISHLKLLGKSMWGKSNELLEMIEEARAEGVNVTADQYPYLATCTSLLAVVPKWANDGGFEKLMERFEDPSERLIEDVTREAENRGGFDAIVVADARGADPEFNGKSILEISKSLGIEPIYALFKVAIDSNADAQINYFSINEEDMFNIMKKPYVSIGSDGYAYNTEVVKGVPHPRNFGSFPQFIEYVRENSLMPIEDAIYKMTKLNADILNVQDRGEIKEGKVADLVVIDWDNTFGYSSFEDPIRRAKGIEYLLMDGELVIDKGKLTDKRLGKVIVT